MLHHTELFQYKQAGGYRQKRPHVLLAASAQCILAQNNVCMSCVSAGGNTSAVIIQLQGCQEPQEEQNSAEYAHLVLPTLQSCSC